MARLCSQIWYTQQRKRARSPFLLLYNCYRCCCCLFLRNKLTQYSDRQQFVRSRLHFSLPDLQLYLLSICKVSVTSYVLSKLSPIPVQKSERLHGVPTHNAGVTCHFRLRQKTLGEAVRSKHVQHSAAQARKQSFPSVAQLLSLLLIAL